MHLRLFWVMYGNKVVGSKVGATINYPFAVCRDAAARRELLKHTGADDLHLVWLHTGSPSSTAIRGHWGDSALMA